MAPAVASTEAPAVESGPRLSVDLTVADGCLVATIDDGKVNVLSFALIDSMRSAIASASERGLPLIITGRDGCFSAGST